jgi:hypothetical protein
MSGWIVTQGSERSLVYICVCVCVCVCVSACGRTKNLVLQAGDRSPLYSMPSLSCQSEYFSYTINKVNFTLEQATKAYGGVDV